MLDLWPHDLRVASRGEELLLRQVPGATSPSELWLEKTPSTMPTRCNNIVIVVTKLTYEAISADNDSRTK